MTGSEFATWLDSIGIDRQYAFYAWVITGFLIVLAVALVGFVLSKASEALTTERKSRLVLWLKAFTYGPLFALVAIICWGSYFLNHKRKALFVNLYNTMYGAFFSVTDAL